MSQHVYARLTGFGWTLLPLAPFRFERVDGRERTVLAIHDPGDGPRRATINLGGAKPIVHLGERTSDLGEVLDLIPGGGCDHWRIETTVFTARWPSGFALASPPGPGMPSPFDLLGPDGALIYVQGPLPRRDLRGLDRIAAPDQVIRRHGRSAGRSWWPPGWAVRHPGWSWVELEYRHEGSPWRQVYRLADLGGGYACVVTKQAPEQWAEWTDQAAEEVAASIARFEPGPEVG